MHRRSGRKLTHNQMALNNRQKVEKYVQHAKCHKDWQRGFMTSVCPSDGEALEMFLLLPSYQSVLTLDLAVMSV